jgi:hypothetical protein
MERNKKVRLDVFNKCHILGPDNVYFSLCMYIHKHCYLSKEIYLPANIKGKIMPIITKEKKSQWLLCCG